MDRRCWGLGHRNWWSTVEVIHQRHGYYEASGSMARISVARTVSKCTANSGCNGHIQRCKTAISRRKASTVARWSRRNVSSASPARTTSCCKSRSCSVSRTSCRLFSHVSVSPSGHTTLRGTICPPTAIFVPALLRSQNVGPAGSPQGSSMGCRAGSARTDAPLDDLTDVLAGQGRTTLGHVLRLGSDIV